MSVQFIDLLHYDPFISENNRVTCLQLDISHGRKVLKVIGSLSHGYTVEPKSLKDADLLIQWVKDWKNLQESTWTTPVNELQLIKKGV